MMLFSILVSFLALFLIPEFNASPPEKSHTFLQLDAISQTDLRITPNGRQQSAPANLPSRSTIAELYQHKFKPQRFDHVDPFLGAVLFDFAADYVATLQIIYFTEKLIALPVASKGARAPPLFTR